MSFQTLLVNTYPHGGAANACLRLHEGLCNIGVDSQLLLREPYNGQLPNISTYRTPEVKSPTQPPLSLRSWWHEKRTKSYQKQVEKYQAYLRELEEQRQFIHSRPKGLETFFFPTSNYDITKSEAYQNADLINLHWVADFLDYESFFRKNKKPVVWTLHDMNPFLGGEHYKEQYLGITEEGKPIKRNVSEEEQKVTLRLLTKKVNWLSKATNLHVVAPSLWLTKAAERSGTLSAKSYRSIPYGLNIKTFTPKPKAAARAVLGLPGDKKIILFVAESLTKQRKGFAYLQHSLKALKENKSNVELCAIGAFSSEHSQVPNVTELGYIQDERLLSIAYAAADVFVIPSLMDNLPNTVLESLCCGTPVVGFPVGGIPDMVQDGKNGYLCPEISVDALTATLEKFLANPEVFDREEIAKEAAKKYALEVQAEAYKKLYEEILTR